MPHFLLLGAGYFVTLLLIRWVVLNKQRQPSSTVAWILTIMLLPYFGGLLFLFFGINRVDRRQAKKLLATRSIAEQLAQLSEYQVEHSTKFSELQDRLMRLATRACGSVPTSGNHVDVLVDTNAILRQIEEAIAAAKSSIHVEYYIWRSDETGTRVRDLLIQKAKQGVTVRFLYDQFGSVWLNNKFLNPMRLAGIQLAPFLPGPTIRERWSINLRSHRKIVVCDGNVAFTGGMNIGDEYLGRNKDLGHWRDTHLKLHGPSVLQLQQIFAEDWFYATGQDLTEPIWFPEPDRSGDVVAQVVSGGPGDEVRVFLSLMFAAINQAKEKIHLATCYFVPTDALVTALESAAYRGVKVRLLVPRRSGHHWTVLAGRSYYDSLLRAGVEIYEYRRGVHHSKTLTIDGSWSLIGTPNFDSRSLLLNFENGVAFYDPRIAAELEAHFEEDLDHSRRVLLDLWMRRPTRQVFTENLCRLFSPVM